MSTRNHCYGDLDADLVIDYRAGVSDGDPDAKTKRLSNFKSSLISLASKQRNVVVLTCVEVDGLSLLNSESDNPLWNAKVQRLYVDPYHSPSGMPVAAFMQLAKLESGEVFRKCPEIKTAYLTIREGFHERVK